MSKTEGKFWNQNEMLDMLKQRLSVLIFEVQIVIFKVSFIVSKTKDEKVGT